MLGLHALSQRKLNALGLPVCYIDVSQRFRFVNRAYLDWIGRTYADVIGREVVEVDGRELFQLYSAYIDAAIAGERVSFERQLSSVNRNAFWVRVDYYPDRGPAGDIRGVLATFTDEQTRSVPASASGIDSISARSPGVIPFSTSAEKPPM